jgi:hypothetical protein
VYYHLAIETPGPQQRRVKDIGRLVARLAPLWQF